MSELAAVWAEAVGGPVPQPAPWPSVVDGAAVERAADLALLALLVLRGLRGAEDGAP